jgi:isopenicillin N synthase-like dioxygenase
MSEFSEITVLDLSPLYTNDLSGLERLSKDFLRAYSTAGFAYVSFHGVPDALIDGVFDASARFHNLPLDQKMKVALDPNHRGFIPINTSTDVNSKLADVTRPNQSESFMMMREDAADSPDVRNGAYLAGPNQWPELSEFSEDVSAFHDAMSLLGNRLIYLAALSLRADPDTLTQHFRRPTTWLRLLHYPPTDPIEGDDLYGSAPHTDFGALTILAQDDIGGLQVQTPSGTWIDAPRIDGTFVVNVGDMLHRWSNGILKSTPHRVINRSGRPRFSCPFFFDPHVSTSITPLDGCVAKAGSAHFAPLHFGDFLKSELEASYDAHKKVGQT